MFIRRKAYAAILRRGVELAERLDAVQTDLSAFAESLAGLQERLAELSEEKDGGDEFKQERAFLEGLRGIMSYEAPYGKKQEN